MSLIVILPNLSIFGGVFLKRYLRTESILSSQCLYLSEILSVRGFFLSLVTFAFNITFSFVKQVFQIEISSKIDFVTILMENMC